LGEADHAESAAIMSGGMPKFVSLWDHSPSA